MRISVLILFLVMGTLKSLETSTARATGAPPIEIRLVGRSTPEMETRIEEIQDRFPGLERRRTTHFEILTDLAPEEAGRHGELLERTSIAVDRFCKLIGVDGGSGGQERHLVVAFASRYDFLRFAAWSEKIHASWLAGYFAPAAGHLAYHHQSDSPQVRSRRIRIGEDGRTAGDQASTRVDEFIEESRRARLDEFIAEETSSVIVHEAVHMLLHHRGVVVATQSTPIWFLEGLAGSFEPDKAFGPFGPDRLVNGRTGEFRDLLRRRGVTSVEKMVGLDSIPATPQSRVAFYATSAQLSAWLVRHRPDDVRRFIELLRHDPHADQVAVFEAAFGPCERIERAWLGDEQISASLAKAE